jgi:hypothetical protein
LSVISNPQQRGGLGSSRSVAPEKIYTYTHIKALSVNSTFQSGTAGLHGALKYKNWEGGSDDPVLVSSHKFVLEIGKIMKIIGHNTVHPDRGSNREPVKQVRRADNFLGCLYKNIINVDNT